MPVHPASRIDRAASLAFAASRGFGRGVAWRGGMLAAAPLPFHLVFTRDGRPRVIFHVGGAHGRFAAASRLSTGAALCD